MKKLTIGCVLFFVKFRNNRVKGLYKNITDLEGLDKSSNNLVKASNDPTKYNAEGKGNIKKIYENLSLAEDLGLAIASADTISSVLALAKKVFSYEKKIKIMKS